MIDSDATSTRPAFAGSLPSPARIVVSATLWSFTSCFVAPFAVAALFGFVEGLAGTATLMRSPRYVAVEIAGMMLAVQLSMLAVACAKAPRVGMGDRAAGLGNLPVRRHGWIALMTGVLLAFVTVEVGWALKTESLRFLVSPTVASYTIASRQSGMVGISALFIMLLTITAPIAEEVFFRGWMWTGLRHRWAAGVVATVTAILWLVMHLPEYRYKPVTLLPLAVVLSLARHYGRSVRASIVVHMANNGFALLVLPAILSR